MSPLQGDNPPPPVRCIEEQDKEPKIIVESLYPKRINNALNFIHILENNASKPPIVTDTTASEDSSFDDQGALRKPFLYKYRGFFYTLLSSLCFSLTAVVVKYLHEYHPINVALWRYQGAFLPAIPLAVFHQVSSRSKAKRIEKSPLTVAKYSRTKAAILLLCRSILTCNALLLHFYSLRYLEIGDALVISSSTPAFAYFFAHYFLGEPCGILPIVTSVTTLFGVMVILRPPHLTGAEDFDLETLIGTILALGCTLLATISFVVLRYLRRIHYSTTVLAFGCWGIVENLVLVFIVGVFSLPKTNEDWILAGVLAVLTLLGQLAIVWALQCEQTGPVSLIRTCDVIFGFIWQMIFRHTFPDIFSMIGATIVIFGVVMTGIRKWLGSLPVDCSARRKLWFLLK